MLITRGDPPERFLCVSFYGNARRYSSALRGTVVLTAPLLGQTYSWWFFTTPQAFAYTGTHLSLAIWLASYASRGSSRSQPSYNRWITWERNLQEDARKRGVGTAIYEAHCCAVSAVSASATPKAYRKVS